MMAKMKNGATPSHCVGSRMPRASAGGAVGVIGYRRSGKAERRSCAG